MTQLGKYVVMTANDGTTTVFVPGTKINHKVPLVQMIDGFIGQHVDKLRSIIYRFTNGDYEIISEFPEMFDNMPDPEIRYRTQQEADLFYLEQILASYNKTHNTTIQLEEIL